MDKPICATEKICGLLVAGPEAEPQRLSQRLPLQSQQKIRQDLIAAEPHYDSSWLAAGDKTVTAGMVLAKSSLADTHNPGMELQEGPKDKQTSTEQRVLSHHGKRAQSHSFKSI